MIEEVRERQTVIANYESKFLQVRSIIEKQDSELRQAHSSLQEVRESLQTEEARTRTFQERIE